jgi:hypothetical protein
VPDGTPKERRVVDLESLCRVHTEQNINRLVGYARSKDVADTTVMEAIKILLSYGHGRPKQPKEHSGPEGGPIQLLIRDLVEEARAKRNK